MTDNSKMAIDRFISTCDELITSKYLVAENKIQKLLGALAETPPVYELVSECMEQFNRDREIAKAFIQKGKGQFLFNMPTEEYKIIALTFCVLANINSGRPTLNELVKNYFSDDQEIPPFKKFVAEMIIPFRNLIAEAFGYPLINIASPETATEESVEKTAPQDTQEEQALYADEEIAKRVLQFPTVRNMNQVDSVAGLEKLCVVCQRIAAQILEELEESYKQDSLNDDLKSICYAIIMACSDQDFDLLRGLALGMKYAAKGVKNIKFLVKELLENIDKFYNAFFDFDD